MDSELTMLSEVDRDFIAQGVSSMDTNHQLITGCLYGGLAILWAKTLGQCKPILYKESNHFMALEITVEGVSHLFVNVCSSVSTPYVYFMGDFNSDLLKVNLLFGAELKSFCNDTNIVISDMEWLHDCYTFLGSAHNTVSWIDHVICTNSAHSLMNNFKVLHDKVSSDHFPICAVINIQHPICNSCRYCQ